MATLKPKATLTLNKGAAATSGERDRHYSTRAKQAARRDGRDLPIPKPRPAIVAVGEEKKSDYRSKTGKLPRAKSEPVGCAPTAAKPDAPTSGISAARTVRPAAASATHANSDATAAARGGARGQRPPTESRSSTPRADVRRATPGTRSGDAPRGGERRRSRNDPAIAVADRNVPRSTGRTDVKRHAAADAPRVPGGEGLRKAVAAPSREDDGMVRVSKLLSEQGLCSRREADSYIARGWVWADGVRVTELGTRVVPTAKLTLDQHAAMMQDQRVTILLNKPIGYVSGQAEDGYQPASVLVVGENQLDTDAEKFQHVHRRGLAPAGRLDIDSTGLLVLTQDGRIAKQLVGENSPVEKEYLVRVEGKLAAGDIERLRHGLELDGEALKPAKVRWQNADQLNFILQEGKKRQIRRICELVGLSVIGLKRIRIGNVMLGDLPVGKWRFLRGDESFV